MPKCVEIEVNESVRAEFLRSDAASGQVFSDHRSTGNFPTTRPEHFALRATLQELPEFDGDCLWNRVHLTSTVLGSLGRERDRRLHTRIDLPGGERSESGASECGGLGGLAEQGSIRRLPGDAARLDQSDPILQGGFNPVWSQLDFDPA